MVIGFLGKGGSGKSTFSTRFTKFLHSSGHTVLAVDGDHNMDLSYNLGAPDDLPYLGSSLPELMRCCGLSEADTYKTVYSSGVVPSFCVNPADAFTEQFSVQVAPGLRVMAGGPQTDQVMYGQSCSHILTTALKVYLPFLKLGADQMAVVDEKAGLDGVTTGIPTGFTCAVVIAEATPHGVKAARQIAEALQFYQVPFEFLLNKVRPETAVADLQRMLPKPARFVQRFGEVESGSTVEAGDSLLVDLLAYLREQSATDDRLGRTLRKFRAQATFGGVPAQPLT